MNDSSWNLNSEAFGDFLDTKEVEKLARMDKTASTHAENQVSKVCSRRHSLGVTEEDGVKRSSSTTQHFTS